MIHRIQVTQEDVVEGKRSSSCECPVARAIRRQTDYKKVAVWYGRRFSGIGLWKTANGTGVRTDIVIPTIVIARATVFDTTGKMKPFEFTLEIPDAV